MDLKKKVDLLGNDLFSRDFLIRGADGRKLCSLAIRTTKKQLNFSISIKRIVGNKAWDKLSV
ncbi:hypothetical protein D3C78_1775610 [compost metagenome]